MTAEDLEPLHPDEAVELYLQDRSDIAANTKSTHEKRLSTFTDWCASEEIDNLNELGGRDIRRYKIEEFAEKEDGGEYSGETVRGYIDTLRVFLRFCASIDAVESDLPKKAQSPHPENSRDEELEADRAETILEQLEKYEYASIRHTLILLMWRTGCRVGTLRGINLGDIDKDGPYIKIRHRPAISTPLKNQEPAERTIGVSEQTMEAVGDYIDHNRSEVTDDDGHEPLLASKHGRRHVSNLREIVYSITRPCEWGDCPHDRQPVECDAAKRIEYASKCPSTVYPHAVRRGAISHMLRSGVPKPVVVDRVDVSGSVLDEHYNTLEEEERADRRRTYFEEEMEDY